MNTQIYFNDETFYLEKQNMRWAFVETKTNLPVAFGKIKKEAITAGMDKLKKEGIENLKFSI